MESEKKKRKKKLKQRKKKALKKKSLKLNQKKINSQSKLKEQDATSLSKIQGYKEFRLEQDVRNWSDDARNEVVISVVKMKEEIYQVKVGVVLGGLLVQSMMDFTNDVERTIENLCGDIHLLLSHKEPFNHHFHYEYGFI